MRFYLLLLLSLTVLTQTINYSQSMSVFPLIISYLEFYDIKLVYFFTCWNKQENIQLHKKVSKINVKSCYITNPTLASTSLSEKSITYYGYVLDYSCQQFHHLLLTDTNKYKFRMSRPWLVLTNSKTSNNLADIFKNIALRMDSNFKLVLPSNQKGQFKLLDVYNPGYQLGEKAVMTETGFWNGTHLNMYNITFYPQRRNMSSVILRSGSVVLEANHSSTFEEYMLDPRYKQLDTMSKFHYSMFLLLEEVHNFTHTLRIEDKWFGNYQNGTDGGIGKWLYEEKVDVTCTGASQRPPRVDVYDYLMPSYHFRPCYIFRDPGTYNPLSNEFLKPFSQNVWILILFTISLISLVLKTFYKIENEIRKLRSRYSWATVGLMTLSTLFQQGSPVCPNGHATRLVFFAHLLMTILLYNYYTSSIISSLLSKPPAAFTTLDELGHSKLEIGIEDLPYTITWFEIINNSDVQYIYKHKVFPPGAKRLNIYPRDEGMAKVKAGGFAYHTQLDTGYPIIARTFDQEAICDINEIPMIPQVFAGIMAQKKSQYKELFHVTLRLIRQAGLVHRISQIWESKKPQCLTGARIIAVGGDQTFIAFLALFMGMGLSVVFLLSEIVWFRLEGK